MPAAATLRLIRRRAGLTLRELAARSGTSHSTLAAYESGRVVPGVATMNRIAGAAGFTISFEATPRMTGSARERELLEVLALAAHFPARFSPTLDCPPFGSS